MELPPRRMPAEWEPHRATWISWPHEPGDFPGKLQVINWVYVEIVRILSRYETVEIVVHDEATKAVAVEHLTKSGITENYRIHELRTDRSWLRDSAPTAVKTASNKIEWIKWDFNAWAKYSNYAQDRLVPELVSSVSGFPLVDAARPETQESVVLEGGAIDTDGQGTLLTTEECLLSSVQERNPGLSREDYQKVFKEYLGIKKVIWLDKSCEGDDTHGHIDDVARFVSPGKVILAYEENPKDPNHANSVENLRRLKETRDAKNRKLEVTLLPMPPQLMYDGYRLPASYANFYIGNEVVIVPTFNDEKDRAVLNTLAAVFPGRKIIGIYCGDLILGFGTLHCLTQQEPAITAS
jgi:agmatine deiminase